MSVSIEVLSEVLSKQFLEASDELNYNNIEGLDPHEDGFVVRRACYEEGKTRLMQIITIRNIIQEKTRQDIPLPGEPSHQDQPHSWPKDLPLPTEEEVKAALNRAAEKIDRDLANLRGKIDPI